MTHKRQCALLFLSFFESPVHRMCAAAAAVSVFFFLAAALAACTESRVFAAFLLRVCPVIRISRDRLCSVVVVVVFFCLEHE